MKKRGNLSLQTSLTATGTSPLLANRPTVPRLNEQRRRSRKRRTKTMVLGVVTAVLLLLIVIVLNVSCGSTVAERRTLAMSKQKQSTAREGFHGNHGKQSGLLLTKKSKPQEPSKDEPVDTLVAKDTSDIDRKRVRMRHVDGIEHDDDLHNDAATIEKEHKGDKEEVVVDPNHEVKSKSSNDGSWCLYDGHCPVRMSCSVPKGDTQGEGVCEPIISRGHKHTAVASKVCFDACIRELQIDEHYYHETNPVVEWTEDFNSQGRPTGCLIVYRREPEGDSPLKKELEENDRNHPGTEMPQSVLDWVKNRFHHIKRVDPWSDDPSDDKWLAYCTSPCQSDADCQTNNDPAEGSTGYVCENQACVRNIEHWKADENPMVLVSGATGTYFRGLKNLAASARYWAPTHKLVVYNLGNMKDDMINVIKGWSNLESLEWEHGVPSTYPDHFHTAKKGAWKWIIVNETLHKYKNVFWLDAGSSLVGPIDEAIRAVQHHGMLAAKRQDLDMTLTSHKSTFQWFRFDKDTMKTGPSFGGGTHAHLWPSRYGDTVLRKLVYCAMDESCIAPEGSTLRNHRYDQTLLSIAAYQPKVQLPHFTEFLAAGKSQLNPDLLKPSFQFVYTARQACQFYASREEELNGTRTLTG